MKADVTRTLPQLNSKAEQWIQWHKDLRSNFGRKVANSLWIKAWGIRGSNSANTGDLRDYLDTQGIKIDKSSWDSVVDFGGDISDSFGDLFTVGKYVGIGLTVILVGGLGMLIFNLVKNPIKSIGAVASLKKI